MNYIVTKPVKSKGIAVLLIFLFGGFGLFYATLSGGLIMVFLAPIIGILLFYIGAMLHSPFIIGFVLIACCFYYVICFIWALIAVGNYNRTIIQESSYSLASIPNIHQPYDYSIDNEKSNRNLNIWICVLLILLLFSLLYVLYYKGVIFTKESVKKNTTDQMVSENLNVRKPVKNTGSILLDEKKIGKQILNDSKTAAWKVDNEERYFIFSGTKIYMILNGVFLKIWHTTKNYMDDEYSVTETKEKDKFLDFGGIQIIYKNGKTVRYDGQDFSAKDIFIRPEFLR